MTDRFTPSVAEKILKCGTVLDDGSVVLCLHCGQSAIIDELVEDSEASIPQSYLGVPVTDEMRAEIQRRRNELQTRQTGPE